MGVLNLLEQARAAGLHVTAKDGHLVVAGPREAEGLARELGARKGEVLEYLSRAGRWLHEAEALAQEHIDQPVRAADLERMVRQRIEAIEACPNPWPDPATERRAAELRRNLFGQAEACFLLTRALRGEDYEPERLREVMPFLGDDEPY